MNINGGNNTIAPNATKIEQHIHITIKLPCRIITFNLVFNLFKWGRKHPNLTSLTYSLF